MKPFDTSAVEIPDPTVTVGNVGRIYRNQDNATGIEKIIISTVGDVYQTSDQHDRLGQFGRPCLRRPRARHRHLLRGPSEGSDRPSPSPFPYATGAS